MKKYKRISYDYFRKGSELFDCCVNYLTKVLKQYNNHIDFTKYRTDYSISVVYDGGNHPEYASNAFSFVEEIFVENRGIYLSISDCSEYPITSCTPAEVYDICDFIDTQILPKMKENE